MVRAETGRRKKDLRGQFQKNRSKLIPDRTWEDFFFLNRQKAAVNNVNVNNNNSSNNLSLSGQFAAVVVLKM